MAYFLYIIKIMKKIFFPLLIIAILTTNILISSPVPAQAQGALDVLPSPRDLSGIIDAAPESFDVTSSAAEVIACSSGLYNFASDLIAKISSALKCGLFGDMGLAPNPASGTKCTISMGGSDTDQACREWVQRKQAELKKYLAQVKKILIASYVRRLVDKMAFDIVDWIGGKTTGTPQFITNWEDFIWGTAKESIGDAIQSAGTLSFLCTPFRARVVFNLSVPQRPPLPVCTLDTIMENIENFYDDFRTGGWVAFNEVVKPQNNPIGAWLMYKENLEDQENRAKEQQALKGQSGYAPTEKCTKTEINPQTGQEECVDSIISIPGQAKSDLTSKALAAQVDKAESYMITEADLLGYAEMIGSAIVNRLVKSAKTAVFGGKEYGEGLLNLPETGDVVSDKYSCERAATLAMCVADPDGTMTKSECDATCKAESYRCDTSGSSPICVADVNGTMTQTQCETMCSAKYSCVDAYGTKMCAVDPNGQYATEDACKEKCETKEGPSCSFCTGTYVRGRYSYPYNLNPNDKNCSGSLCGKCSSVSPGKGACGAFCQNVVSSELWPEEEIGVPHTFGADVLNQYQALFSKLGYATPATCTCNRAILGNQWASYGISAGGGACRGCTDLPIGAACSSVDWCDENCNGTEPKPTHTPEPTPVCSACNGVFVRGRYYTGSSDSNNSLDCDGPNCKTCSAPAILTPCNAFCLNTKENTWTGTKTFTQQEMLNLGYQVLFDHFGWEIPNSCTCHQPMDNYSFGMGYGSGLCQDCIALPAASGLDYNFAACKSTQWCDQNCGQ